MTYITGGDIQAADHNTFATAVAGMNELYADIHAGATTLPTAGYGYGQAALTSVAVGETITGVQWAAVFDTMRASSTHQTNSTSTVVPPLPATGPFAGQDIAAVAPGATVVGLINTLKTNRFSLHASQRSVLIGTPEINPAAWTTQLTYTFQADFGSWDNARHFFNTGSSISIAGAYSPASTPVEIAFANMFTNNFPVSLNWETTTPLAGGNVIASPAGFYNTGTFPGLTTAYQSVYRRFTGSGGGGTYYSTNYGQIEAKLNAAAGTNGKIDFRVSLFDGDSFTEVKPANRVTITVNRIQSAGAVPYLGAYTFTSGGFVST